MNTSNRSISTRSTTGNEENRTNRQIILDETHKEAINMRSIRSAFRSTPEPTHFDTGRIASVGRPRDVRSGVPVHEQERMYALPRHPLAYITMYQGMLMNVAWRFAVETKISEKFRRRIHVVVNFSAKCRKCSAELHNTSPDQPCPVKDKMGKVCGGELRPPSRKELDQATKLMENVNLNGESLCDVFEQIEPDICVADEGYLIKRKDYVMDKNGDIQYEEIKETVWGSPIVMRPCVDHRTGTPGGVYYVCPGEHRNDANNRVLRIQDAEGAGRHQIEAGNYETSWDAPLCKKCGEAGNKVRMQDVKYVSIFHERGEIENHYIDGEIEHWHEHLKGHTFSVPPALTLWVASSILTYKDAYVRDSYYKQRKPRGAVVVSTSNPADFMNQWDSIMEQTKKDWHFMPVIPFEPEPGISGQGGGRIAWVDFMGTMQDLEYKEIREIYERMIYQFYGISNIYANLEGGSSAKAAGEDKLLVSNHKMERSINVTNVQLLKLGWEYGFREVHWEIVPPEDRDQLKLLQIQSHKMTNAQMMETMGYEPKYDSSTKEFSYKRDPLEQANKLTNLIGSLATIFTGGMPTPAPEQEKPNVSAKPKVDSAEFTGTSRELQKALADEQMHEGDAKSTPASSKGSKAGYYAPDGTGPFASKQALGGYMRTKGGSGSGTGGAPPGTQPGGMPGDAPQLEPDDYDKLLDIIDRQHAVEDSTIKMFREVVDYARTVNKSPAPAQDVQSSSETHSGQDGG